MNEITDELIDKVCELYNDTYDDRKEDSSLGGQNWLPGRPAGHKSLAMFKAELNKKGFHLSTGKIRKILITGGLYSTSTSRAVAEEYEACGGDVKKVAEKLHMKANTVYIYLPYSRTAYNLDNKTSNAKRIKRWRLEKKVKEVFQTEHGDTADAAEDYSEDSEG